MNLNFVNLLACILLASDWFKNNQLLSELTHAHYRVPVPLTVVDLWSHADCYYRLAFDRWLLIY